MYVKRGFFSCCQHNKLIRAYEGFFFSSVRSYQDTAEQDKAGLMKSKAKGKKGKGKGKGKGKRPEFRCTDLWFDMYSSVELEFVICFFVFVSSELSFNIPKVRYTLGSLVFVEVGCSFQVLLLLVVYADPWLPGTNRLYAWTNHLPHLLTT